MACGVLSHVPSCKANKTILSTTMDGTTIRRMPNLVTFRDDPDAMLVMALEHYDERTGLAEKAAILHHDVVGRHARRGRQSRAPRKGSWFPSTSVA
jgi:N12 class adenine-specific DNA methylase